MPKLAEISKCTGCAACVNACPKACITMKYYENGFYYPSISSDCIECRNCESACAVINWNEIANNNSVAYAGFALNNEIRTESSSGGIFTILAVEILKNNGVVYGASYDDSFSVEHICVSCIENLSKLRGAKYAQSNIGTIFKDIKYKLDKDFQVLFSGTPCQVVGLKKYLMHDYENLFTVDFVCHGIPSPEVWSKYIDYRIKVDNQSTLPISINLRSKVSGWSKWRYSNLYEYRESKYQNLWNQDTYMKLFVNDYIIRESCFECAFKGYDRASDLTIGDFWGIWNIAPEMDDDKGTSLIICHSKRGQDLLNQVMGEIKCMSVSLEEASKDNPSLLVSATKRDDRDDMLRLALDGRFTECRILMEKVEKLTLLRKIKSVVRHILS